jgi:hypothetical protein
VPLADLPYIDAHAVDVDAPADVVFDAVLRVFTRSFANPFAKQGARLLGCDPPTGFRIAVEERPTLLVVSGSHRFSRYGIVFRIEPTASGARLSAESRAEFPGLHGRLYRAAVIGTRGHVVAVRQMLGGIKKSAERSSARR